MSTLYTIRETGSGSTARRSGAAEIRAALDAILKPKPKPRLVDRLRAVLRLA